MVDIAPGVNRDKLGFDKLLDLTDSRYRLSVIVAKRSMQLEKGFPNLLSQDEYPENRVGISSYEVALAIQELILGKGVTWGDSLPSNADLVKAFEVKRADRLEGYSVTPTPQKSLPGLDAPQRDGAYF